MEFLEFKTEMDRFYSVFGKMNYPGEREKIIWDVVKAYTKDFLYHTISEMVGTFTPSRPPQIQDFRLAVAQERERLHQKEKLGHSKDADDFFHKSQITDEDRSFFMKNIQKRMTGAMPDPDWDAFMRILNERCGIKTSVCSTCLGSGLVFDDQQYVYRCSCAIGRNRPERFSFEFTRKSG